MFTQVGPNVVTNILAAAKLIMRWCFVLCLMKQPYNIKV